MAKFFGNLHAVLGVGLVLALALIACVPANGDLEQQAVSWLHTVFGILCIGLFSHCSFVQFSTMS